MDVQAAQGKARRSVADKNAALQYDPSVPICAGEGTIMSKPLTLAATLSIAASALFAMLSAPGVVI